MWSISHKFSINFTWKSQHGSPFVSRYADSPKRLKIWKSASSKQRSWPACRDKFSIYTIKISYRQTGQPVCQARSLPYNQGIVKLLISWNVLLTISVFLLNESYLQNKYVVSHFHIGVFFHGRQSREIKPRCTAPMFVIIPLFFQLTKWIPSKSKSWKETEDKQLQCERIYKHLVWKMFLPLD